MLKKGYYECSYEWLPIVIHLYFNDVFGKLAMNSWWILMKGFFNISQFLFNYSYESFLDAYELNSSITYQSIMGP
jgi:hypothetical protein